MVVNNTHSKHVVFLIFGIEMASPQKILNISQSILCSLHCTQSQTIWHPTSFKKFRNYVKWEGNTYTSECSESAIAILECRNQKINHLPNHI